MGGLRVGVVVLLVGVCAPLGCWGGWVAGFGFLVGCAAFVWLLAA